MYVNKHTATYRNVQIEIQTGSYRGALLLIFILFIFSMHFNEKKEKSISLEFRITIKKSNFYFKETLRTFLLLRFASTQTF